MQWNLTNEVLENDLNIIIKLLDHTKKYFRTVTKGVEDIFNDCKGVSISDNYNKHHLPIIFCEASTKLDDFSKNYQKKMDQIFKYLQNICPNYYRKSNDYDRLDDLL